MTSEDRYHEPVVEWIQERFNCKITIIPEGSFREAEQPDILFQKARWMLNEMTDWELGTAL